MKEDPQCNTCMFHDAGMHHCCFNPPQIIVISRGGKLEPATVWPVVAPLHWCSKWKEK